MSFATVYNTPGRSKKGRSAGADDRSGEKRYDPDTGRHNHLICTACKKVVDVQIEYDLQLPKNVMRDFTVVSNHIEFYGFCPDCKEADKRHLNKEVANVRRA
jgi:Fur family peroxide stress response transcriptional regulator